MSKLKSFTITGKRIGQELQKPEVDEILKSQKKVSKASLKTKKFISLSNEQEDQE